jgi:membrane protein implicated in regulation of membrane protease activity
MIWQQPWIWIVAGLALGIAETLLPGFILLGFAIGAVLTGALLWLGVLASAPVALVLLVFAVGSALGWLILKRLFTRPGQGPKIWRRDINDD